MSGIKGKQIEPGTVTSTEADTATGTLSTINAGDSAVAGSAVGLSNRDHQHGVATGGTTAAVAVGDSAAEGSSSNLAREDHVHALTAPAAPANVTKSAAAAGAASTVARSDHKHDVATAVAVAIGGALAEGSSTSLSRADHVHTHGNQSGGALHSDATTGVAGFMSATDKLKLDALQDAAGIDAKESVRCRTQADHGLSGLTAIDGITPLVGDRVLVDSQTTTSEDGIYIAASGAWARSTDMATATEARGAIVHVEEGTADGDNLFQCTNNAGSDVVGTDDLTFSQIGSGSPRAAGAGLALSGNDLDVGANGDGSITVNADDIQVGILASDAQHGVRGGGTQHADVVAGGDDGFMTGADKTKLDGIDTGSNANKVSHDEVVTTQVITGTDTAMTDTLAVTPNPVESLSLYLNGVKQQRGTGKDYTVSAATITWLASSGTAVDQEVSDVMEASYLAAT